MFGSMELHRRHIRLAPLVQNFTDLEVGRGGLALAKRFLGDLGGLGGLGGELQLRIDVTDVAFIGFMVMALASTDDPKGQKQHVDTQLHAGGAKCHFRCRDLKSRSGKLGRLSQDKVYRILWSGCTLLKSAPDFKIDIANMHQVHANWVVF